MINRPEHDNCAFHAPTPDCNPNNERSQTPNYVQEKHKVKTGLSTLFFSRLFTSTRLNMVTVPIINTVNMKGHTEVSRREFLGKSLKTGLALAIPTISTRKSRSETIIYNIGKLRIVNWINDFDFDYGYHTTFHQPGGTDGYDELLDVGYSVPPFWINPVTTKIISRVSDYELGVDARNLDSFAPVNLDLSLHSEHDTPINVSNLENWLKCVIDPNGKGWDFGVKPITLWRRFPAEPDKLQFLADIREACAKQGGTGIVPLGPPNLDGEYPSQVPYDYLQVRFDVYPGDFDLHSKVDLNDFSHLAKDWGRQGEPREFIGDITGPQGLPDGKVDGFDLERYVRDYLKDIRDIMP